MSKTAPAHPKYEVMIAKAIVEAKSRTGLSRQAIESYIASNYTVNKDTLHVQLRTQFRRLVEKGLLVKHKGSFKLSEALKTKLKNAGKPKKAQSAKKTTTTKKSETKKTTKKAAPAEGAEVKAKKPKATKKPVEPKAEKPKKAAAKKAGAVKKSTTKPKKEGAAKTTKKPAAKKSTKKTETKK